LIRGREKGGGGEMMCLIVLSRVAAGCGPDGPVAGPHPRPRCVARRERAPPPPPYLPFPWPGTHIEICNFRSGLIIARKRESPSTFSRISPSLSDVLSCIRPPPTRLLLFLAFHLLLPSIAKQHLFAIEENPSISKRSFFAIEENLFVFRRKSICIFFYCEETSVAFYCEEDYAEGAREHGWD
jgi:hypothetical protein